MPSSLENHTGVLEQGSGEILTLGYSDSVDFTSDRVLPAGGVLGVVAFGINGPMELAPECLFGQVNMPALSANPIYEIWGSQRPVTYECSGEIISARSKDIVFGHIQIEENPDTDIETIAFDAYSRMFEFVDSSGFNALLRVWNYIPEINESSDGLPRYQRFNLGRHEAFAVHRRKVESAPAACAVGTKSGPVGIFFLAGRGDVEPIENPRQVSAYHYPSQYGPRSPVFTRASLATVGGRQTLFVSGTASVVGHESMHVGDPKAQADETIKNIHALLSEARSRGFDLRPDGLHLKVYVRRPEDFPVIRDRVSRAFNPQGSTVYILADICRPELLLEIEGVGLSH